MDEDQNLASLFATLNTISAQAMGGDRAGGGTGGGSLDTLGNMDPNPLIGLNPYLEKNVTSFKHGGRHKTYKYDEGGKTDVTPAEMITNCQNKMTSPQPLTPMQEHIHRMASGRPSNFSQEELSSMVDQSSRPTPRPWWQNVQEDPTAFHQSFTDMYGMKPKWQYDNGGTSPLNAVVPVEEGMKNWMSHGSMSPRTITGMEKVLTGQLSNEEKQAIGRSMTGQYEQQANQMIALNQLSNVFKGLQQRQGSMLVPQANKGMKMRKRYTQGGRF